MKASTAFKVNFCMFLGKRVVESAKCSSSSEADVDPEVNDGGQTRLRQFKQKIRNTDLSDLFKLCKSKCSL